MTFNIRYGHAEDGRNSWENRGSLVANYIKNSKAHFIGMQEALGFQLDEIVKAAPSFRWIGEGRDGHTKGEYTAILYDQRKATPLKSGTFWLSDTPKKPSATWGNHYRRTVTWGLFNIAENGAHIFVYNTHFDHQSETARNLSSKALQTHIREHTQGAPIILLGDFNAAMGSAAMQVLASGMLQDGFEARNQPHTGTFHNFEGHKKGPAIDHILYGGPLLLRSITVDQQGVGGQHLSDHFPVTAHFRLR